MLVSRPNWAHDERNIMALFGFDPAAQQRAAMEYAAALQHQVSEAWGTAAAAISDPDTVAFMQLPPTEQAAQQAELQAWGRNQRELYDHGTDVDVTIQSLTPTGRSLGGQREYTLEALVTSPGMAPRTVLVRHILPAATFHQFSVGTRHRGKVAPHDSANVGVFELIG